MKRTMHAKRLVGLFATVVLLGSSLNVRATDDDTPFFAGRTGSPNVMVIMDTSNSMQDSPYFLDSGFNFTPLNQTWKKGVVVTQDCNNNGTADDPCILDSTPGVSGGTVQYDLYKYVTTSDYLIMPGRTAPSLPGLSSPKSLVTSIADTATACAADMECDDKIYDSSVTWTSPTLTATIMNETYKYWKVAIRDTTVPSVQYRNLLSYGSGYWTVSGGVITYNPTHSYEYEIISESPGNVTYKDAADKKRVYDKNFDWGTLTPATWTALYNGHVLEVSAGTNQGVQRTLTSYNAVDGYWIVNSNFGSACDTTTDYHLLNTIATLPPEDDKTATGGNHPDSKMYQAKLALQTFLESDSIKTCDGTKDIATGACVGQQRYLMNLGFATYLQARTPITRAKYYRKVAGSTIHHPAIPYQEIIHPAIPHDAIHIDEIFHPEVYHPEVYHPAVHHDATLKYWYRYKNNHGTTFQIPNGCFEGVPVQPATFTTTFSDGNTTQTLSKNQEFNRVYSTDCTQQTIRYRVTDMVCSPTDSLPNRMNLVVNSDKTWVTVPQGVDPQGNPQWGYSSFAQRTFTDPSATCATYTPPATVDGGAGTLVTTACFPCTATAAWDDAAWTEAAWTEAAWTEPAVDIPAWTEPAWTEVIPAVDAWDEIITHDYYQTTIKDITGDIRKKVDTTPGYVHSTEQNPHPGVNYVVTPYKGECSISGDDWLCTNPDPLTTTGDGKGDYTLLTSEMVGVRVSAAGAIGTITPLTYDNSTFKIPSQNGDTNHPHGWSYKRTANATAETYDDFTTVLDVPYIYAGTTVRSKWGEDVQKSPYFPSLAGSSKFSNFNGDDQAFFVDFPVVNEAVADKGDDLTGANVIDILDAIGLNRAIHPESPGQVYTMAPISKGSLSVSTTETVVGQGTPIAATLRDAKKYFESYMAQDTFTQGGCRQNYIILLTDGLESCDTNAAAIDAAKALQEIVVNGEKRPVKVYVIGFGLDKSAQTNLNAIAAAGGSVKAYFANDVNDALNPDGSVLRKGLVSILSHDIVDDVLSGSYGRSKAVLSSANLTALEDLTLYYAYFDYPVWRGHLEAWNIDPETGELTGKAPYWASSCTTGKADAGCIIAEDYTDGGSTLVAPAIRRHLFTSKESAGVLTRIDFAPSNLSDLKSLVNPDGFDINGNGIGGTVATSEDQDAIDIINFVHHPGYNSGAYKGNRDVTWPLADIYNSSPVIVPAPANGECQDLDNDGVETWPNMTGYCQHKKDHKTRETVIYVGTNGGTIEAIAAGKAATITPPAAEVPGGYEKWGFIPKSALGNLRDLRNGHKFSMDLPVVAAEVDTSEGLAGTGWKTMLVAGQRKGGTSYTALDVTDPDVPKPMWEFTDPNLGQTWSAPAFGRIIINGMGTSVIFFGGGFSLDADVGNSVYIVRASDGAIIKEFIVGGATNDVPGGLRTVRYLTSKTGVVVDYRTNIAKLPDGTVVDYSDRRYCIETAYFGDTTGTLWRLSELNNNAQPDDSTEPFGKPWSDTVSLTPLYVPDLNKQMPIYYRPMVYDIKKGSIDTGVKTGCVVRYILAGTGDEQTPTMTKDGGGVPITNYFIEIEDREWSEVDDGPGVTKWTVAQKDEGKFRLNWRLNLGRQLPREKYGFLLAPDGSRVQTGGRDILDLHTHILDRSKFDAELWTINAEGNLKNAAGDIVSMKGEFLIRHDSGPKNDMGLYADYAGVTLIAADNSYVIRDFSLWLVDEKGCYIDTDGSCLVDADNYQFNNDGWLTSGGIEITKDGEYVSGVLDFGEKLLSEPSTLAGNIYFTTYSPQGGCAMGTSYFHGLQISTCTVAGGKGVLKYDANNKEIVPFPVRRIGLGFGITPGPTIGSPTAYIPKFSGDEPVIETFRLDPEDTKLKYWRQN